MVDVERRVDGGAVRGSSLKVWYLIVRHHGRLLLHDRRVLLDERCVLLIRRRRDSDVLRGPARHHQRLPVHLYELLLTLHVRWSNLRGVERHLLVRADVRHYRAQLIPKRRCPVYQELAAVRREELRAGAVLLNDLAAGCLRRSNHHPGRTCCQNALTRIEYTAVALHRCQHVLTVHVLYLQLHADVPCILQQGRRPVGRHDHTPYARDDELLNRGEILDHTGRAVQQIHRLQKIDLLSRLRIRDDLLGVELSRRRASLTVHHQLSRCPALARHDRQRLQHRAAYALSLEVLLGKVRLRLHQHAGVLLRRGDVQHRGHRLRVVRLSFLVRFLLAHRRLGRQQRRLPIHHSLARAHVPRHVLIRVQNRLSVLYHVPGRHRQMRYLNVLAYAVHRHDARLYEHRCLNRVDEHRRLANDLLSYAHRRNHLADGSRYTGHHRRHRQRRHRVRVGNNLWRRWRHHAVDPRSRAGHYKLTTVRH